MRQLISILLIFLGISSYADDLGDKIQKQTRLLKRQGVDTIIVHRYSQFTGRFSIPYNDNELLCDKEPIVAHIFWIQKGQWNCLRLDNCGLFERIEIETTRFDKIVIDEQVEFKKTSAHFTAYRLTKIIGENEKTVLISGTQLRNEKNETIETFRTISEIIEGLENNHKFKRVK